MSLKDHRYNTSPKGVARQRKYDRSLKARMGRRCRDLRRRHAVLTTELDTVRKELETIG